MKSIDLQRYSPIISDKSQGEEIYQLIRKSVDSDNVEINLLGIKSMATFCAKQIFGRLYVELGPSNFFEKVSLKNANNDIKTIIKIGIQNSLENT